MGVGAFSYVSVFLFFFGGGPGDVKGKTELRGLNCLFHVITFAN